MISIVLWTSGPNEESSNDLLLLVQFATETVDVVALLDLCAGRSTISAEMVAERNLNTLDLEGKRHAVATLLSKDSDHRVSHLFMVEEGTQRTTTAITGSVPESVANWKLANPKWQVAQTTDLTIGADLYGQVVTPALKYTADGNLTA